MLFKTKILNRYKIQAAIDIKEFLAEHYEFADEDDYDWQYVEKYPLAKLCLPPYNSKQKWRNWLANERQDAIEQFGDDHYYDSLSASPTYPIIITDRDVVDGNHRVALALERSQKTIPTIVGHKIR